VIRPARPGDVAAIHRLVLGLAEYENSVEEVVASEDDLRRALFGEQPAVFAHVATRDGAVAGFALWFLTFSTWTGRHGIYLEDLYVTPELRGHGYGKALLAELARICVERGYARFEWAVLDWNTPAIGFYRALGAAAMDEWTVAGPALQGVASQAPVGQAPDQVAGDPPR
jgi:GNAT superfamily N-acetyltransferase